MNCSLAQSLTAEQSLMHSLCCGQTPVHSPTLMYISWSLLAFHEITTYFPPKLSHHKLIPARLGHSSQVVQRARVIQVVSYQNTSQQYPNHFGNIWNIL